VTEGILQALQERIGRLLQHHFAAGLPTLTVTEHYAKQMRPTPLPLTIDDPGTLPKVHLHFVAGVHFHSAERQLLTGLQSLHEPENTEVAASKAVLGSQILMDALGRQVLVELALNDLQMWPAETVCAY
jgi:hypothetical protein